ncbi:MAG: O-antigen ligase family protein [Burkholderiales bacterium]|nr:O-antigen ligase family protein [Burkholderiales bacterium]
MAATSVSKLLIVLAALAVLAHGLGVRQRMVPLKKFVSIPLIVLMLAVLALSVGWSEASTGDALSSLAKYGKLLVIPLVLVLVRNRHEALVALACYLAAEAFVLFSSVLLGLGVPLPWRIATLSPASVFSSYLDQSIMTAGFAALCWHLRAEFPRRWGPTVAVALALLAIVNVMFQLPGRTGHLCAIAAVSLALFWATPRRWRLGAMAFPVLLVGLALVVSPQFKQRATMAFDESQAYEHKNEVMTSTGLRLNLWRSAAQAIAERPVTGWGAGSWSRQYLQRDNGRDLNYHGTGGNPHQEYLLWGVHLGVPGIALLIALLGGLAWDSRGFAVPEQRGVLSLVALLAVACLFNSTLYDALIGDYFCILLGVLFALGLYPRPAPPAAAAAA